MNTQTIELQDQLLELVDGGIIGTAGAFRGGVHTGIAANRMGVDLGSKGGAAGMGMLVAQKNDW